MKMFFTYGSLMKGGFNHRIMESIGAKFMENAQIRADKVTLTLPFPAIKEGLGLVSGEMYEVSDDAIEQLDALEGHPSFYTRKTVYTTEGIDVEVYFGNGCLQYQAKPLEPELAGG